MGTQLSMAGDVADIMEALGHHESAANLRWSQRPAALDDLVRDRDAAELKADGLAERVTELAVELADEQQKVASIKLLAESLPGLIELLHTETESAHENCGECALTRLVVTIDELRRVTR